MKTTNNHSENPLFAPEPFEVKLPVLTQQGSLLKVKTFGYGLRLVPKRGVVSTFSARSRKRMLETTACLDKDRLGFCALVTLTLPDGDTPPTSEQTTTFMTSFLKRIKRRFPEASAIWRREWEERKSGDRIGDVYPHFHILFFNLPFIHYEEVNRHWAEVIGCVAYVRTEIKQVHNIRHAITYVAKYMAKVDPRPPQAAEDFGRSGERRPWAEVAEGGGSLVNAPYLAANENDAAIDTAMEPPTDTTSLDESADSESYASPVEFNQPAITGRHWGVFNRKWLPLAERRTTRISFKQAERAKREAATFWSGIDPDNGVGFTLFMDDAVGLFDFLCELGSDAGEGEP